MGRRPRSCLDLALPDMSSKVQRKQQTQKFNHDQRAKSRTIQARNTVNVRNFPAGNGWLPGIIVEANGPLSFQIKLQDGRVVKQHIDHIIHCSNSLTPHEQTSDDWMNLPLFSDPNTTEQSSTVTEKEPAPLRRSTRISVPPKRYGQAENTLT